MGDAEQGPQVPSVGDVGMSATPVDLTSKMLSPSAVPRYLRRPGDDGYRTPTIDDIESEGAIQGFPFPRLELPLASVAGTANPAAVLRSRLEASQENKLEPPTNGVNGLRSVSPLPASRWPENLRWKERIQHFTWTYFTLTMATGGLASTIHSGEKPASSESFEISVQQGLTG
jgi:hypothetical protein